MNWRNLILTFLLALSGAAVQAEPGDILMFDTGEYNMMEKNKAMERYMRNIARLFIIMRVSNEFFTPQNVSPALLTELIVDEAKWNKVMEQVEKACERPPAHFRNSCEELVQERLEVFETNRGRRN